MRATTGWLAVLMASVCMAQESGRLVIDFEGAAIDQAPTGFTSALTGQGRDGVWVMKEDTTSPAGAKVLVQTDADRTNYRFPVIVYDGLKAKDVEASVAFKPISGEKDQAAGIVWRYQDKNNYYIVRANALENNVVLYKMQDGKRADIKLKGKTDGYGQKIDVPKDKWSTLKVSADGDRFVIHLNGEKLFEVEDQTFTEPGKVGVWTKADSVTAFDRLTITPRENR